jgi:adenylate cyclase
MKAHGRVFIGAQLEQSFQADAFGERVIPPTPVLRRAAAAWGLLTFRPIDSDLGVRYLYTGTETIPTATWRMAQILGADLRDSERIEPRWINYYGPANGFLSLPYDRVLSPDGVPAGFFKDKVVFVGGGGRAEMATLGMGKDYFRQPSTLFDPHYVPGAEIHATIFRNLAKNEWLTRWSPGREDAFIFAVALLLGIGLPRFHWLIAAVLAALFAIGITVWARGPLLQQHAWFDWCVPVMVQTPIALGWAWLTRYFLVERRRSQLHRALQGYLSPELANLIAESEFDLNPGGVEVEVSVMFTDIEGFTGLSERLPPAVLSSVLTEYFTRSTDQILLTRGTIVKFIGDAVLAVWGAPLPDGQHPVHAALSACQLQAVSHQPFLRDGHSLRLHTRVGVHTGLVISGNLGSAQRFDYTVIGDGVNFASRLEGVNKHLGTSVLISDATQQRLGDRFDTRCVGIFRVSGKAAHVVVHELLGSVRPPNLEPWREKFATALAAFQAGQLEAAESGFNEAARLRGESGDSVSQFYLQEIVELKKEGLPPDWQGVVNIRGK